MRLALSGALVGLMALLAYLAMPFWSAWTLREAIRTGDRATVARMVEWDSVRASLKGSLTRHARLVPEINENNELARPGMWQRIRMALGQPLIDGFVDRYVSPDGLSQLFEARRTYNSTVGRKSDEEAAGGWERFKRFWARLKRAEFQSPTRLEIEIEDRSNADRHYVGVMELRGFEWRLTALMVKAAPRLPAPVPIRGPDAALAPAPR